MDYRRRAVLKLIAGSGLAAGLYALFRPLDFQVPESGKSTFAVFLDTLIPADETPSASALELDAEILASVKPSSSFQRLITQGCAWLELQASEQYGVAFTVLEEPARVAIVQRAEASAKNSMENVFFRAVRDDVLNRYYARVEAWPALGYAGPPQPDGFPDHSRPPKPLS